MRALVVDDDANVANGIAMMLKSGGTVVDEAETGQDAIDLARVYDYDVIFLDLQLPDIEGYEVIRRIRSAHVESPILILSGISRSQSKIKALAIGADDYITKPFDGGEVFARMQALVRRSKGYSRGQLSVGKLQIDIETKEVTVEDKSIHLTAKEYSILELLILRKGAVISKETFLNHLYGGIDEPDIKIIDVFICKLRKKLSNNGVDNLIKTVWGRGYSLNNKRIN